MIRTRIPPPVYALCTAGLIWLLNRYVPSLRWVYAPWNELEDLVTPILSILGTSTAGSAEMIVHYPVA